MWPNSNIGILLDDMVVLDIDCHGSVDGYESFKQLEDKYGALPDTVSCKSGGGGLHFYFLGDAKSRSEWAGYKGVDRRGRNSYALAPPSVHVSGGVYEWDPMASLLDGVPMAPVPDWLLEDGTPGELAPDYGSRVVVRNWGEGERNANLARHAGLLRRIGYESELINSILQDLNRARCTPQLDPTEVSKIAWSISRYPVDPVASRTIRAEDDIDVGSYPMTDGGNADLFVRLFGDDYLHVSTLESDGWLRYTGGLWTIDPGAASRDARLVAARRREDAANEEDETRQKAKLSWAKQSDMAPRIRAMLEVASFDRQVAALHTQFDSRDDLLATPSGVVELRSGKLRDAERSDFLTKCTGVPFDSSVDTSAWEQFILDIMDGDKELAEWLQRAVGYTLTGSIGSQCWFMLYGPGGRNGKSTLLDVLHKVVGSYGRRTVADTWLYTPGRDKRQEIASLYGVRMTVASELKEGRALDEELIKTITGDSVLTGRYLYKEPFDFRATCKLWLGTNHLPRVSGGDPFWRRLKLIPFNRRFPVDPVFAERMKAEAPAALLWAVRGAVEWYESPSGSLGDPEAVRVATEEYQEDTDALAEWVEAAAVVDEDEVSETRELFESYCQWCEAEHQRPISKQAFARKLGERGFRRARSGAGGRRVWRGIGLRGLLNEE